MEAIANRSNPSTKKLKVFALAIVLLLSLAGCCFHPDPKPAFGEAISHIEAINDDIKAGRLVVQLPVGIKFDDAEAEQEKRTKFEIALNYSAVKGLKAARGDSK